MKVQFRKFQEGGAVQPAPAQDPMVMIVQLAQQALQGQDCDAAMQACQGLLEVLASAQGGGAEPAPAPAPEGEPVFAKGGKLVRRVR